MRLIDADKMIKDLTERYEDNLGRDVILKLIGEQPEAYNVQEVVEAIDEQIDKNTYKNHNEHWNDYWMVVGFELAREIVKAGGQHE